MSNHEVPFKNAKKDHDGYATILVKFGGWYVPVKGKPLPLIKEEVPDDLKEIKRINLTRWNLKDIPEIAKLVGKLCGSEDGYTAMLYWNSREVVWKFYNEGFGGIDDESDEVIDELNRKIDELDKTFYKPHDICTGNMGDEDVHCIYLGNSNVKLWDDGTSELKKRDIIDELLKHGPKCLKVRSISLVENARRKHQNIPYAEIGEALRYAIADLTNEQLGKLFLENNASRKV